MTNQRLHTPLAGRAPLLCHQGAWIPKHPPHSCPLIHIPWQVYKGLLDGVQPVAVKVVQGMGDRRLREAFLREVITRFSFHRKCLP